MTEREKTEVCPLCKGGGKLGYLSSNNSKPPELGDCYKCDGTGRLADGESATDKKEG